MPTLQFFKPLCINRAAPTPHGGIYLQIRRMAAVVTKTAALTALLLLAAHGEAFAQVDTYHVFKDGAVLVTAPGALTTVAYVDAPSSNSRMVVAKTEVQNGGTGNHVTCQLEAVENSTLRIIYAWDPVTNFVAQGQFAGFMMTLATPPHVCGPDAPCSTVRYRVRCGALWTTSATNLFVRQTKITAHNVLGVRWTSQ